MVHHLWHHNKCYNIVYIFNKNKINNQFKQKLLIKDINRDNQSKFTCNKNYMKRKKHMNSHYLKFINLHRIRSHQYNHFVFPKIQNLLDVQHN